MCDFDFIMMIIDRLGEYFEFIDLRQGYELLVDVKMVHTKGGIGSFIGEELFVHKISGWDVEIFTVGEGVVGELGIEDVGLDNIEDG